MNESGNDIYQYASIHMLCIAILKLIRLEFLTGQIINYTG